MKRGQPVLANDEPVRLTEGRAGEFLRLAIEYGKGGDRPLLFTQCKELVGGENPAKSLYYLQQKGLVVADTLSGSCRPRNVVLNRRVVTVGQDGAETQVWPIPAEGSGSTPVIREAVVLPLGKRTPSLDNTDMLELVRREFPTGDFSAGDVVAKTDRMPPGTVRDRLLWAVESGHVILVSKGRYQICSSVETGAGPTAHPVLLAVEREMSLAEGVDARIARMSQEIERLQGLKDRLGTADKSVAGARQKLEDSRKQVAEDENNLARLEAERDQIEAELKTAITDD